jgi:signal transduction histidine kinase
MVSHELKNRAGAISGAAALLREPWVQPEPERQRFLGMVTENAARLRAVLQDLAALSRLDHAAAAPPRAPPAGRARGGAAAARAGALARRAGDVDDDLPTVEVNAAAVELCLTNYISNAIKYSDPARPERGCAWPPRCGRRRRARRRARGLVRDNGIGVPARRSASGSSTASSAPQAATVTGVEGTGLGLSIVRDTVEELGGRAWAEWDAGPGSTFCFALPCRRVDEAPPAAATADG